MCLRSEPKTGKGTRKQWPSAHGEIIYPDAAVTADGGARRASEL
jgi:hypothetical protein